MHILICRRKSPILDLNRLENKLCSIIKAKKYLTYDSLFYINLQNDINIKNSFMKNIFLIFLITTSSILSFGQRVNKITLSGNGATTTFSFLLDENVIFNIAQDGAIGEWGIDKYADRPADYIQHKLEAFAGRVEYYTNYDNEAFRGKIKYIGRTLFTYYASYDEKYLVGKLKSVGPINLSYYSKYDDVSSDGKLKSIGQMALTYYSSFDNDAYKGKIKTTGNVAFTYYPSLEDKAYAGKIKSINGISYTYYSSMDQQYLRGALKSGNLIQVINGINYFIRN